VAPVDATAPGDAGIDDTDDAESPVDSTLPAGDATPSDAMPGSDEAARRPRRRRGRRGGRRGRGGERPDGTRPEGAHVDMASDGGDAGDEAPDDAAPGDDDRDGE
jgi:ribonuclease E